MIDVTEVTRKLIGPVEGVGETNEDERRLENLKTMIAVVDGLLFDISFAARDKDSHMASVKAIGQRAAKAMADFKEAD